MYNKKEELAWAALKNFLESREILDVDIKEIPDEWKANGATFVTLKIDGKLRGCIGTVEAFEPLYKNIIRNAISAGFSDPRFSSLTYAEFNNTEIEVSVLTEPQIYSPVNNDKLIEYLENNKPGLIIEKENRKAVFLPQVWEEIKNPGEFLSHLCLKAGLNPDAWKDEGIGYKVFNLIK